jgi:hypothetical protein
MGEAEAGTAATTVVLRLCERGLHAVGTTPVAVSFNSLGAASSGGASVPTNLRLDTLQGLGRPAPAEPSCAQCRTPMELELAEPVTGGYAIVMTFKCRKCGLAEKVKPAGSYDFTDSSIVSTDASADRKDDQ